MNLNANDLYRSILFRAADIYDVDYEDVERDVGQQFDPIIRFMAGATAHELERVYQHVHDTESRLQKRLAKVLLPEYFHLPQPAHALATATPTSEPLLIEETTMFVKEPEDEEKEDIAFSPVFNNKVLPATIKVVATELKILDPNSRPNLRKGKSIEKEEARRLIIGVESSEPITNWEGASLFFDLRGRRKDESDRARFFAAIPNSQCRYGGYQLNVINGLPQNELILEDYLNGNQRLQTEVRARYQRHFLTFGNQDIPEMEPILPQTVLGRWFSSSMANPDDVQAQLAKLSTDLDKPLYWLEVEFSRPIELEQLTTRLSVRLNVFPVVNRRLNGHGKGEHHYLQTNSIKWVSLQPKEDFVAIRRVYEEKSPYPVFTFKPFADFQEERKPAYTLRYGGVGRWDDFNAWQRLAYVVSILQDNYQANELVQMAASSLSLEDVHHLLGKKISKTATEQKPTRDIYVLLHSGITSRLRVRVEYWTSQGETGNGIAAKSILKCTSNNKSSLDKETISLISVSTGGRDPLNATQQLDAMKSSLLSRGRIVTREDVKIKCKEFLQDKLSSMVVQDGVGTDPRFNFGMTRLLDVVLTPSKLSLKGEDWEGICQQLQTLLEGKSTSSLPIRVRLSDVVTNIT